MIGIPHESIDVILVLPAQYAVVPRQLNDHLGDEHTGCGVVRLNDLQRIDDTDVAVTVYVVHDILQ